MTDVRSTTDNLGLIKYSRGHPVTDIDLGTNMDLIDAGVFASVTKVSSTTVSLAADAATTLYTVPTGKIFIPVMAIIRIGADAGTTTLTFGRSTAATDWLGTQTLGNLDADGDFGMMMPAIATSPATLKTYAAAVLFDVTVASHAGGAANVIDLFGYLVDA